MTEPLFSHIRSVLALDGILPSRDFFSQLNYLPLIAADGAGKELLKMKIFPQLIVGDLDSLKQEKMEGIEVIQLEDQNQTDFEKTLTELETRGLLPTFIVGTSGKELDHTLYNLNVINRFSKQYRLPFLATDDLRKNKIGFFCRDQFTHAMEPETLISLLPFPEATVTTRGLVWDVKNTKFDQEGTASIRNRVRESAVNIKVHSGTLLILFDLSLEKGKELFSFRGKF